MARPIIIDTDPGQDDAVAILMALGAPELEVLGLTTVAGNVPVAQTTINALRVLDLAGRGDIPVHAGAAGPLLRPLETAEMVHGPDGLAGPNLPPPRSAAQPGHAVPWLAETVMARPAGTVWLACLAPLTNIALAFALEPRLPAHLAGLVMMGGAFFNGGNSTPVAEFNVMVDPHAAQMVLQSGVRLVMMPLDLTHQTHTTAARIAAIRALGGRVATAAADLLAANAAFDQTRYGRDGAPLHDPCVTAWLIEPSLFRTRDVHVTVELRSPLTEGMTVMDWWGMTSRRPNAAVAHGVDEAGFYSKLQSCLEARHFG